jgi:DNA-damage-inducible protein D
MVRLGSGSARKIEDWFLSRYACYLIAMNGDPRVEQVAYAQQYFAIQTRLQEKAEEYDHSAHRRRVAGTVKALNSAAKKVGVQRYGLSMTLVSGAYTADSVFRRQSP